jgi:GDP-4-dehydro-6-deoxy-D-mannose reductase
MRTALVIGDLGFAGQTLTWHLHRDPPNSGTHVEGYDLRRGEDIRDYERLRSEIERLEPDHIYMLAAQPSPAESWVDPRRALDIGVAGTLNLLEACRALDWRGRLLLVGSEAEYGLRLETGVLPEWAGCEPASPYGVAKLAATTLGMAYHRQHGLHVVVARPSYHTGPGQHSRYAISGFARQVAEVEAGHRDAVDHGDLAGTRHVLDVRDVVRAYRLLVGQPPGIYNVSGGTATTMGEVLKTLIDCTATAIPTRARDMMPRSAEPPLTHPPSWEPLAAVGWSPTIPLEDTLRDLLDYWRHRL